MLDPFEEPMATKARRPTHWTIGRVVNDLAIVMIAVPTGIYLVQGSSGCMNDPQDFALAAGLLFFTVKSGWKVLKFINDSLDPYLPNHDPGPKPPPQDDY